MATVTIFCYLCGKPFEHEYFKRFSAKPCPSCYRKMETQRQAVRRANNREQYNSAMKEYRIKHNLDALTYQQRKERMENDPEFLAKVQAQTDKYRSSEKGKQTIKNGSSRHKRRLKESGKYMISAIEWQRTLKAFGNKCAYCDCLEHITQDHFIPVTRGGKTVLGNIVPACKSCNSRKRNRLPEIFMPGRYDYIVKVLESLSSV